jgi:hypothetical protein
MEPEDMIQNGIYYFADHGNGMEIVQYDRMESNNVYTFYRIRPSSLLFSGAGLWGPVANTGAIRFATPGEILHLLACITAGIYVPA